MSKIVLVGQAPSRDSDPGAPLSGRSGRRLASLAGVEFDSLGDRFERVNVFDSYPGLDGVKGDEFDVKEAKRVVDDRLAVSLAGRRVVLLGRKVAAAFGVENLAPFCWKLDPRGFEVAVCPHPSGVNLFWNSPENVAAAKAFFSRIEP